MASDRVGADGDDLRSIAADGGIVDLCSGSTYGELVALPPEAVAVLKAEAAERRAKFADHDTFHDALYREYLAHSEPDETYQEWHDREFPPDDGGDDE